MIFRIFASVYDSEKEMRNARTRDFALDLYRVSKFEKISANNVYEAAKKIL